MEQNLFLAPASTTGDAHSHLEKAVIDGLEMQSTSNNSNINSNVCLRVWGINSGLESTWSRAEPGDWILFYTGNNEYRYAVQIKNKEENPQLGSEIRNIYLEVSDREDREGKEWHFLFYLRTPLTIELCAQTLSEWLNYERAYRSRFQRVPKERLQTIEKKFETLRDMVMEFTVE